MTRNRRVLLVVLATVFCLTTLSGCFQPASGELIASVLTYDHRDTQTPVAFDSLAYTRPSMADMERQIRMLSLKIRTGRSLESAFASLLEAEQLFLQFNTMYVLSIIYGDMDVTDPYWQAEVDFFTGSFDAADDLWYLVEDAAYASHFSDLLLPVWSGISVQEWQEWDEYWGDGWEDDDDTALDDLYERRDEITQEACDLIATATVRLAGESWLLEDLWLYEDSKAAHKRWYYKHGPALLDLYAELAGVQNSIALAYGYDGFTDYMFDYYYERDYTPRMAADLIASIEEWIFPVDYDIYYEGLWDDAYDPVMTFEEMEKLIYPAVEAVHGDAAQAYDLMREYGLYDVQPLEHKIYRPYAIQLPLYNVPFLMCSYQEDLDSITSFTHEFGHFYEMTLTKGHHSVLDDLSETHSQAMSTLVAQICLDQTGEDAFLRHALIDAVDTLVANSTNMAVELAVYALAPQERTADAVAAIAYDVFDRYGYTHEYATYGWLTDEELFTKPFQPFAYVPSACAALELWSMYRQDPQAALSAYRSMVEHQQSGYFLANLSAAVIADPFEEGWAEGIAQELYEVLIRPLREGEEEGAA